MTAAVSIIQCVPNKKETRIISEISSLATQDLIKPYMLHYQRHFLFFHFDDQTQ